MVALISACGSNAPAGDAAPAAARRQQHRRQCSSKAVKFAQCMRDNGVSDVPGPGRVGQAHHRWDRERLVAGPEHPGVPAGPQRVQGPGATGVHGQPRGAPSSRRRRLKFAQCIRDNGVPDFPDPTPDGPLVDTNRMPIRSILGGMSFSAPRCRSAAMHRSGSWGRRASDAEDVGAGRSGRPGCRYRHRRRGRHVRCEASGPGRTGAAGEHREGGKGDALGHGLPGWDPDLSGAIGRLAVLGDQPGPGDIHRAARARPGDLARSGALPGGRQPGGVAVWLDTRLPDPVGRGEPAPTSPSSTPIWSRSAMPPRLSSAQPPPPSGRPPPPPWRSSRPPWE